LKIFAGERGESVNLVGNGDCEQWLVDGDFVDHLSVESSGSSISFLSDSGADVAFFPGFLYPFFGMPPFLWVRTFCAKPLSCLNCRL